MSAITAATAAAAILVLASCDGPTPPETSPGPPAAMLVVSGNAQQGTVNTQLANPIVVQVLDAEDEPIPGQIVNFVVTKGNGQVFAGAAQTNANGIAQELWTLGTVAADSQKIEVRAVDPNSGAALVFATFVATAVAGPAAAIEKAAGDNAQAATGMAVSVAPSVLVEDQYGNPVSGTQVAFGVASGGGSVTGASTTTNSNGIASVGSWTLGSTGANTLTATATGLTGSPLTFAATGTAGMYSVTANVADAPVGTDFVATAQLTNHAGAPLSVAGRVVTWSRTGGAGTFSSATSTTNAQGVASVTFTVGTFFSGDVTIMATDAASATGSKSVSLSRGAPAKLYFVTQPLVAAWRMTMASVKVGMTDAYDNVLPTGTNSVTLTIESNPGSASIEGGAGTAMVGGVATFASLMLDQPGTGYILRAASGTLQAAISSAFDVVAEGTVITHNQTIKSLAVGSNVAFSASGGAYSVPLGGGSPTQLGFFGDFGVGMGRMNYNGTSLDFLHTAGSLHPNGSIHRIQGGSTTTHGLTPEFNVGLNLEFDGTYFFTEFSAGPSATESVQGVFRLRASDGNVTRIVERPGDAATDPIMTVAGGFLYFADSLGATRVIKRVSVEGGTPTIVATTGTITGVSWRTMLVIGSDLYWTESGKIVSVPAAGGTPVTKVSGLSTSVRNLVSDGTYLWVNDGGNLRRYDLASFTPVAIDATGFVADVALDAHGVYWVTGSTSRVIKKRPK